VAIIKKWSGDGLAPGVLTTTAAGPGDTAFDLFYGDPGGTYPNIVASGPRSPQLEFQTANSKSAAPAWNLPALTKSAGRFYFTTPAAWNSASHSIAQMESSGAIRARISISGSGAPGQLRIANAAAVQVGATANNTLALSTRYRIEWTLDHTTGIFSVNAYTGDGTTALATLSATSDYGTSINRVVFGAYNTAAVPLMQFDDFAVADTAAFIGPYTAPQSFTPVATLWDGSTELPVTVSVWNGAAEVPVQ
jgi:hypothetical protein